MSFAILWSFIATARYGTREYAVTSERVIARSGFVSSTVQDVRIEKIEGVELKRYALDEAVGSGTLTLSGTGGKLLKMPYVADAQTFREAIYSQIQKLKLKV